MKVTYCTTSRIGEAVVESSVTIEAGDAESLDRALSRVMNENRGAIMREIARRNAEDPNFLQ